MVKKFPRPKTIKQLQSFLGLVVFVEKLSWTTKELFNLLKKDIDLKTFKEAIESDETRKTTKYMKTKISNQVKLALPTRKNHLFF